MNYRIVSDSSANLQTCKEAGFVSVPLKILAGDREFTDDSRLNAEEMTDYLQSYKGKSGTSCPNIADWLDAFEGADGVFAVTITSALSGAYTSAAQAAREFAEEGGKAFVVDSLSTGPEMELLIRKLEEEIASGKSFEEITRAVTEYQGHTHLLFSLQSLSNLAKNGRCSPAVAKIAGVLGIRVVGAASEEGTLEPLHRCRGEKKVGDVLMSEMEKRGYRGGRVSVAHCENLPLAEHLRDLIGQKYPGAEVKIRECGGLCSFYAERGGLIVGFEAL